MQESAPGQYVSQHCLKWGHACCRFSEACLAGSIFRKGDVEVLVEGCNGCLAVLSGAGEGLLAAPYDHHPVCRLQGLNFQQQVFLDPAEWLRSPEFLSAPLVHDKHLQNRRTDAEQERSSGMALIAWQGNLAAMSMAVNT
jgi:hypothetical protein